VKATTDLTSTRSPWLGTVCCLLSALCYTATNICLRQLAEMRADPAWAICIKEAVTVTVVGPWLLWQVFRGGRFSLTIRAMAILVLAGLAVQLAGNLGILWAYSVIGLAVTLPLALGMSLTGSAVIGIVLFYEWLPVRSIVAIALVIGSIVLLSIGVTGQNESPESTSAASGAFFVLLGIAAACVAGLTFASLSAAIRYAGKSNVPVAVTVVVVTGVGVISLGAVSLVWLGPAEMLATEPNTLAWMVASGVFNLVAFALITKGLQLTTLVHANVLSASQVALGATAGILLFREPYNLWLFGGIVATLTGITLFGHPRSKKEPAVQSS